MAQATLDQIPSTTECPTLTLPRSGLLLREHTLFRTGRGGVTIAAHRLADVSKLKLTHRFDVPVFALGLVMALAALGAKAGMTSPTAGWIVAIGTGVLACLLMAGARGLVLNVTSAGVTAAYRLLDQDEECQGFAASATECWQQAQGAKDTQTAIETRQADTSYSA